jgi:hypothetical protein
MAERLAVKKPQRAKCCRSRCGPSFGSRAPPPSQSAPKSLAPPPRPAAPALSDCDQGPVATPADGGFVQHVLNTCYIEYRQIRLLPMWGAAAGKRRNKSRASGFGKARREQLLDLLVTLPNARRQRSSPPRRASAARDLHCGSTPDIVVAIRSQPSGSESNCHNGGFGHEQRRAVGEVDLF